MKIGIKTNHPNRKTDLDQYSLEFFEIFFVRNEQKMFFWYTSVYAKQYEFFTEM